MLNVPLDWGHDLDLAIRLQRDAAARTAKNLRDPDFFFGKDRALLEIPGNPDSKRFLCFVGAFLGRATTRDNQIRRWSFWTADPTRP